MRTYDAPGTVSSDLHNLTPVIFAIRRGRLYYPHFTRKVTEPREGKSLVQGHKTVVGQSQNSDSTLLMAKAIPSHWETQPCLE